VRTRVVIWLLILFPLLFACSEEPLSCFRKSGPVIKEERIPDRSFSSIAMFDHINLIIYPSDTNRLILEGGKDLLDDIKLDIVGSTLRVRDGGSCYRIRNVENEISLHVFVKDLYYMQVSGSGKLHFADTLYQDVFVLDVWGGSGYLYPLVVADHAIFKLHTGSADLIPAGRARAMDVHAGSYGRFDGLLFDANHAMVQHFGSNHAFVRAQVSLTTRIFASGNIYYAGDPEVRKEVSQGSGQVLPVSSYSGGTGIEGVHLREGGSSWPDVGFKGEGSAHIIVGKE
jgi:hypothetical protein